MKSQLFGKAGGICLCLFVLLICQTAAIAQEAPPNTMTQKVTFTQPLLKYVEVNGENYTSIMLPGALNIADKEGVPCLPVQFVQMVLPLNKTVSKVTVSGIPSGDKMNDYDLKTYPIFPYQFSAPFMSPPKPIVKDEGVYNADAFYPSVDHSHPMEGSCKGYNIFSLGLHPVKYNPVEGQVTWFKEMTIRLELKDCPSNQFLRPGKVEDEAWVKQLVSNPTVTKSYQNTFSWAGYPGGMCDPAQNYDYVIITTTKNGLDNWLPSGNTPYTWDHLMNKHAALNGLACTKVTIQDILAETDYTNTNPLFNDTPARIREFCKDAYLDWGVDYILIGGDDEWIPARHMDSSAEGNVDADIYWNHLDNTFNADGDNDWGEAGDSGFDPYAELYIGRITCDIPKDVSNWLKKCFYYMDSVDSNYLDNAAFYGGDTGWSCQGDDFMDFSAIKGTNNWLGPNPSADPYPSWLGFQYGFETWNQENPGVGYDMSIKWTAEPPNPGGWVGGSTNAAISGLRNAISNDTCTLISGIAHANEMMSLDVGASSWESSYHNTVPFFLHDYGCHCGDMDAADDGVLHSMLMHSDTELAFACVYNTGYGWGNFENTCSSSSVQQKSFWDYMFDLKNNSGTCANWQMGKAQAYSKDLMAPTLNYSDGSWRSIIQCCLLFGDPAMKIKPPEEPAMFMFMPNGVPSGSQKPGLKNDIAVTIQSGKENYVPGSGKLHYRMTGSGPYLIAPLTHLGGDDYLAELPHTVPGDTPEFYFSAEGDGGTKMIIPPDAPTSVYSFEVFFKNIYWSDDFESDKGWTVENISVTTGAWERANPQGTSAQPEDDHTPNGVNCFVTQAIAGSGSGSYDLDGGPTRVISPTLNFTGHPDAYISFWVHFYHSSNGIQEPLLVHLSNNNGATWTQIDSFGHQGNWVNKVYKVSNYLTPTSQMKIRLSAEDQPNDSVVEACLDDFEIMGYDYNPSLWADNYDLTVAAADIANCSMDAGAAYAGKPYLLLGSMSGGSPGFTLPSGEHMPINWDFFTNLVLANLTSPIFSNFAGGLNGQGQASATFNTYGPVPSSLIGVNITFAFMAAPPNWDFASSYINVVFNP